MGETYPMGAKVKFARRQRKVNDPDDPAKPRIIRMRDSEWELVGNAAHIKRHSISLFVSDASIAEAHAVLWQHQRSRRLAVDEGVLSPTEPPKKGGGAD